MNELMSDTIDLSSANNSEIIKKCVGIFKSIADFIVVEKKKVKSKSIDKEGDDHEALIERKESNAHDEE
jgi:ribosomal protein L14